MQRASIRTRAREKREKRKREKEEEKASRVQQQSRRTKARTICRRRRPTKHLSLSDANERTKEEEEKKKEQIRFAFCANPHKIWQKRSLLATVDRSDVSLSTSVATNVFSRKRFDVKGRPTKHVVVQDPSRFDSQIWNSIDGEILT